jgi:adenine-specific DNA-methyltransferase
VARRRNTQAVTLQEAQAYRHPEAESPLRPDVGTQSQFKKKKPPVTYRYDSSLSPALSWDGQNPVRELGEWLVGLIEKAAALPPPHVFDKPQEFQRGDGQIIATVCSLKDAVDQLKRLGRPFLDWAGKAERLSFDVPTLPLFVHERLSTKGIIETLTGHRKKESQVQLTMFDLFGDPQRPVIDQVLKAYEYRDKWVNRMVLGDSLVVMNSLLHYEGLGGQVQMIYMDPPYGVRFGSNFQPFVRKRDVNHNDDGDMTREPEMVKAYRDTWELGLHSYLTYLRDRLLLCRELLSESGSIFVQISDENLHHVREVMDEVFGEENFCSIIPFAKTASTATNLLSEEFDYLLWYARDRTQVRYRQLYLPKTQETFGSYKYLVNPKTLEVRPFSHERREDLKSIPDGFKIAQLSFAVSQQAGKSEERYYVFGGVRYDCGANRHWKTKNPEGLDRLAAANRLVGLGSQLNYTRYLDDFPATPLTNLWADTGSAGFSNTDPKLYVVQTDATVVQRCVLMTTDPGDLVLDPTCGSGTTAYVAEQWGRRWITIDTSRVPLALARQRLLTATFPYYQLKDESRGPAGGFVYVRKQNKKGEEVGGIVPHITLKSIANNEPPDEEVLVDRPEEDGKITRVSGPFCVEATIPTPVDWEGDGVEDSGTVKPEEHGSFVDRMLEVLRKSPVLQVGGGKTVSFKNVRPPAKTLSLSAEAVVANGDEKPVALVFGPENGAISEKLVYEAAREAHAKSYSHLYVIGFAIQPNARNLVEVCEAAVGIPATYVQATPDLMMGDLLKNMRSSQVFSVCGLPEVRIHKVKPTDKDEPMRYQVELLGLDVFDPVTMEIDHRAGDDVPAWFLDTDYNGLCFHVSQAFFPRTSAWENLKKALKGTYVEACGIILPE